ncbi:Pentatricopeptide repeat-containing protein [Thalictrum thalictroides]|uniref:Pentatricopeptide repeat-containing protein n=1 Tax=Thalictrum thalictroides TaxID=46969 RepID=A0A7J6VPH4_THATH|nr:Pentatricopeptide repeat-containing protein [Thalictrum thalictroides]
MQFPSIKKGICQSLKNNSCVKALHSLHYTEIFNKRAAEQNCLALLKTCNSFIKLTQVHANLFKLGLQNNPLVLTKFTSTSSNLNAISYAASIILSDDSSIYLYDAFLFNTIIRAFAQTKDAKHNAVFIYCVMLRNAILPNKFTFPFLLKASAGLVDLNLGKQVHGSAAKFGFDKDLYVQNTMIHMYSSCVGGIEFARNVFDRMTERSPVSWSAMIGGYARLGQSRDAVGLFREMQISGVRADEITMVSVLSACADLGALELGKWAEFYIEKEGISKTEELCNALIDMFAKCGDVDEALRVFCKMKDKTIVSWTSVIGGLAMHGRGTEAVALFEEMKNANVTPDDVSFIGLLSACSHAGLVEEGSRYFESMTSDFGIMPKIEHYGCMVDMFSRTGLVYKALELVHKMPFEPNAVIYRTLINACRAHGELELGENITKQLIGEEPLHGSNYVLLSNIYAKMSRWEKKSDTRQFMEKKGLRKIPGCTMLELNNKIYEFVAGDRTHKHFKEIYKMLDEMGRKLKKAGYVSIISDVLLDIDEEDKEDAVNRHSEKLAIAFALLNSPPKTPIRIVKNLRVCGDCHSATKFISKVYDREIVVRDRNRFHHFRDGSCSCKDFW